MKIFLQFASLVVIIASSFMPSPPIKTFYDFTAKDIDGNLVSLSKYKGKKVIVVNVASECGFTTQYTQLEWLYSHYKDSNLVVLGFPCNDFGGQEPKDEKEIQEFCTKKYAVTFPIMSKIVIKSPDGHPLYKWLQLKSENGFQDNEVKWNFNKFMINEDGTLGGYFPSKMLPDNKVIIDWIMNR